MVEIHSCKYLSTVADSRLTWNENTENVKENIIMMSSLMYRYPCCHVKRNYFKYGISVNEREIILLSK